MTDEYGQTIEYMVMPKEVSITDLYSVDNIYSEQLKNEYKEFKTYNPDIEVSESEYLVSALNSRYFEYDSLYEQQQHIEDIRNWLLLGVTIVAGVVCPPAALAIGFGFGALEVGSAIAGRDYLTGRKMETGERISRGIFGALDMLPGITLITSQFESGRKLLDTIGKLKSKSLSYFDDVFKKKKPTLSRGEYLRQKYNIHLTSEELHHRINLRQFVHDETERLTQGLSKSQIKDSIGPVVAGVYDPATGKYYIGFNDLDGEPPANLVNVLDNRLKNMPEEIRNIYTRTRGKGSHAEIYALNEALLEREKLGLSQNLDEMYLYVVNTTPSKMNPASIMPIPRCPHCAYITESTRYFPEVMRYGKITK